MFKLILDDLIPAALPRRDGERGQRGVPEGPRGGGVDAFDGGGRGEACWSSGTSWDGLVRRRRSPALPRHGLQLRRSPDDGPVHNPEGKRAGECGEAVASCYEA
jgi:hypothetical protein